MTTPLERLQAITRRFNNDAKRERRMSNKVSQCWLLRAWAFVRDAFAVDC